MKPAVHNWLNNWTARKASEPSLRSSHSADHNFRLCEHAFVSSCRRRRAERKPTAIRLIELVHVVEARPRATCRELAAALAVSEASIEKRIADAKQRSLIARKPDGGIIIKEKSTHQFLCETLTPIILEVVHAQPGLTPDQLHSRLPCPASIPRDALQAAIGNLLREGRLANAESSIWPPSADRFQPHSPQTTRRVSTPIRVLELIHHLRSTPFIANRDLARIMALSEESLARLVSLGRDEGLFKRHAGIFRLNSDPIRAYTCLALKPLILNSVSEEHGRSAPTVYRLLRCGKFVPRHLFDEAVEWLRDEHVLHGANLSHLYLRQPRSSQGRRQSQLSSRRTAPATATAKVRAVVRVLHPAPGTLPAVRQVA